MIRLKRLKHSYPYTFNKDLTKSSKYHLLGADKNWSCLQILFKQFSVAVISNMFAIHI